MPALTRFTVASLLFLATSQVNAELIATDHFLRNAAVPTTADPAAGEYIASGTNQFRRAETAGAGQNPTIPGFNGPWTGNVTSGSLAVAQWTAEVDPVVMAQSSAYHAGGRARFGGSTATNSLQRRVQRPLSAYTPSNTYYFSLTSQVLTGDAADATVPGFVGIGFTSSAATTSDDAYYASGNLLKGFMIGAYNDANTNTDYVIRHVGSSGAIQTDVIQDNIIQSDPLNTVIPRFTVVRLDFNDEPSNPAGNSKLTVWQNPDASALYLESAASAAVAPIEMRTFALSAASDLTQLTFMGLNWSRAASFDEPRLGTTWADVVVAPENTWITDASSTWGNAANWSYGTVPNGAGARAALSTAISAARTITVDASTTIGTLVLNSASGYTIDGTSALTFSGTSTSITASAGSHAITAPLATTSNFSANIAAGASLQVGELSLAAGMTTSIDATGTFAATGVVTNNGALTIAGGSPSVNRLVGTGSLSVAAGANLIIGPAISSGTVIIRQNALGVDGTLTLAPSGTGVTNSVAITNSLTLTATGIIDIGNGHVIIDHDGVSPFSSIATEIIEGSNGGTWNGAGITSSGLASTPAQFIGIAEAGAANISSFGGVGVDASAVLVRRTILGDTNLDGLVEFTDLLVLAQNYGGSSKAWYEGNFNFGSDEVVDFTDLLALAQNYGTSLAIDGTTTIDHDLASRLEGDWAMARSLVPEPTSAIVIMSVMALSHARRRD